MTRFVDRIQETSVSVGSGDFALGGAVSSFRTFASGFAVGQYVSYVIEHQSANEFETGVGHLSDSTTFVRDTVKTSSNADSHVSFSAGTKNIFHTLLASDIGTIGRAVALANRQTWF